jgi:hypothetical protein
MSTKHERHYVHGDQLEGDASRFYCVACDVFFQEDCFYNQQCHSCDDHHARYAAAIKMVNTTKKSREFGRLVDAKNILV